VTRSDRICAALDFPSWREAEPFARAVAPAVGMLKVGLELFTAEGPPAVRAAAALGRPVFLDLKLHDIPNTVEGAARSAAASGASLLTVHASGGEAMVRAAVKGAGAGLRVLAVTVLTSLDAAALAAIGLGGPPETAVVRLARLAVAAGAGGLVCSPHEVRAVRAAPSCCGSRHRAARRCAPSRRRRWRGPTGWARRSARRSSSRPARSSTGCSRRSGSRRSPPTPGRCAMQNTAVGRRRRRGAARAAAAPLTRRGRHGPGAPGEPRARACGRPPVERAQSVQTPTAAGRQRRRCG